MGKHRAAIALATTALVITVLGQTAIGNAAVGAVRDALFAETAATVNEQHRGPWLTGRGSATIMRFPLRR